jgi:hypothetical protein
MPNLLETAPKHILHITMARFKREHDTRVEPVRLVVGKRQNAIGYSLGAAVFLGHCAADFTRLKRP